MDKSFFAISKLKTHLIEIIFFLYIFASYAVPMMGMNTVFLKGSLYAFVGITWLYLLLRHVKLNRSFFIWYFLFDIMCFCSMVYSSSTQTSLEMVFYLITAFVFGISIITFLECENSYRVIKYSHIITSIIVGGYLLLHFSQAHWWSRLGESFGMNENMVALFFLIPFCFALTELREKKHIIINLAAVIISCIAILLSGSKKALFAVFLFGIIFYWCKSAGITKKMKIVLISIGAVIAAYQLIMRIPLLYNIIGLRIEAMFLTFQTKSFGNTGASTAERGDMIRYAMKFFVSSPLFGHGINTFKSMYGQITGHFAYAHNNYVELLADLGMVGFLLYYSLHFKLLRRIKTMNMDLRRECAEFIAILGVVLFFDIAMVTYYDTRIIMLLAIVFKETSYKQIHENNPLCDSIGY